MQNSFLNGHGDEEASKISQDRLVAHLKYHLHQCFSFELKSYRRYWDFVRNYSPAYIRNAVERSKKSKEEAWLDAILGENSLLSYLNAIMQDSDQIAAKYYRSDAIMRDKETLEMLTSLFSSLDDMKLNLLTSDAPSLDEMHQLMSREETSIEPIEVAADAIQASEELEESQRRLRLINLTDNNGDGSLLDRKKVRRVKRNKASAIKITSHLSGLDALKGEASGSSQPDTSDDRSMSNSEIESLPGGSLPLSDSGLESSVLDEFFQSRELKRIPNHLNQNPPRNNILPSKSHFAHLDNRDSSRNIILDETEENENEDPEEIKNPLFQSMDMTNSMPSSTAQNPSPYPYVDELKHIELAAEDIPSKADTSCAGSFDQPLPNVSSNSFSERTSYEVTDFEFNLDPDGDLR